MKYKLSYIAILTVVCLFLTACGGNGTNDTPSESSDIITDTFLSKTVDAGQGYIDSFIFIGESTTYHLKSRGVLSGGKNTKQVWGPKSGTVNLDTTIASLKIIYPDTGEELTVSEAISRKKPQRVLLTFGLNGAVEKIKRGEDYFRSCYMSLINIIRKNSPETTVVLQSCFPISNSMDMSSYSVDAPTLMRYIETINTWTMSLANSEGLGYLNTSEVLKDQNGFLLPEYDVGDGHHLTVAAYEKILEYIRTHAVTEKK